VPVAVRVIPPVTPPRPSPRRTDRGEPDPRELAGLLAALHAERRFRVEQLAVPPSAAVPPDGAALAEVRAAVLDGARRALADIDDALAAMRRGRYPHCRVCAGAIPWPLLRAIPRTRLCPACQDAGDGDRVGRPPDPS
jgi:RNA polymerase-binding transcription factor DksA